MSDYLIGDIQGCFDSLQSLLRSIEFSNDKDRLFFLGDVVNRGNQSLETLRYIKHNQDNISMVLGNHDFHLLACTLGSKNPNKKDTFTDVINAKDSIDLLDFLLLQPLIINHENAVMVHAGVPPQWDLKTTLKQALLVQQRLQSSDLSNFLDSMYSNNPTVWQENLAELDQCRYTINSLMRMRFCKANGELEFDHKMNYDQPPLGYKAWFEHKNRKLNNTDIYFGHWSTLDCVNQAHIYPMDHGCIWGGKLSAIRLEDKKIFSINC